MRFTKEQRKAFSRMGKVGGRKRALAMTPEARRSQALKAITTRWARVRAGKAEQKGSVK